MKIRRSFLRLFTGPDCSRRSLPVFTADTQSPGPVEDLQSYVKADWWRHIFNANYLRTDGEHMRRHFEPRSWEWNCGTG